ncbi:unnamed protein product [Somion occarium]|uniref:Cyclase n=1 Tax=Somion occarium TaxID=3059160 RepID=A0ABP1DW32_9APHY
MHDLSTASNDVSPLSLRKLIDLTHPLISSNVFSCPGHPMYAAQRTLSLAKGDIANVHTLQIGTHSGTHIDAPYHFFDDGIPVDELDLSLLTAAPAILVDMRKKNAHEAITWEDLGPYTARMRAGVAVLICTGWSKNWGQPTYTDHPYLDGEASRRILETGVRVIGIDAMSPDEVNPEKGDCIDVHRLVLGNGGVIVENLNGLEKVVESGIRLDDLVVSLLPLRLTSLDGSPVRAVAWESGRQHTSIN